MASEKRSRPLVLFADDEVVLHELIRATLRTLDCDVECFTNGADALESLRQRNHDVIIIDLMMPKLNGYEFLRELRMIDPEGAEKTIVLTATSEETWRWFDRESVCAFLRKPVELERLARVVEGCLRRAKLETAP